VPIVFVGVADPVGAGLVESWARPGGNTTGFTVFEYSISGKWLELLKEMAPGVTRVAIMRDASITSASRAKGSRRKLGYLVTGRQRARARGRPCDELVGRVDPTLLTLKRHWLCTAAMVLMPGLSPIKVPV
jgi:hypothetical protein